MLSYRPANSDPMRLGRARWTATNVGQVTGPPEDVMGWLIAADNQVTRLGGVLIVACEDFVVGRRATRSKHHAGGQKARDIIGAIKASSLRTAFTTAAAAKGWATDRRLTTAGLDAELKAKRHAKDAARHALYIGVKRLHWPDPMAGLHPVE
jgi:hypothetical protein